MNSAFILVFVAVFSLGTAMNYCTKNLCPPRRKHIACGHNQKFASSCPKNAHLVDLKPYIGVILEEHNEKRDLVAGGKLRGYPAAARMATMQWDEELASLAALNVKQCTMEHDECRSTKIFKYPGQNLAWGGYYGIIYNDVTLIKEFINDWFGEYRFCNRRFIASYPRFYSGPDIGHFTAMVNEQNNRVGCAVARYQKADEEEFLLACNYAHSCFMDRPVYKASSLSGVSCKSGMNRQYKNLCSAAEVYRYTP